MPLTRSVTWSLCPLSRNSPVSPTTSHRMMSVSLDPDASWDPDLLKRRAVTAVWCGQGQRGYRGVSRLGQ